MKVETIAQMARKQLKLLGSDHHVNLKPRHDGSAHIEDLPNGKYRYVYSERGSEYSERITDNPQDILYWIYQDATFEIACRWEAANRIPGQDFRILLFQKQLQLLRTIGEKYALRRKKETEILLNNSPKAEM